MSDSIDDKIIYTVIIGGIDILKQPKHVDNSFKYFCITDDPNIYFGVWVPIIVSDIYIDNRRTSRVFKAIPRVLFRNSETIVYVDSSIEICGSIGRFVELYCGEFGISLFQHPSRDCVYQEARACIAQKKDDVQTIESQMNRYRQAGYPERHGLVAGGVIVRRGKDAAVDMLGEEWMREIGSFSFRDQLSLNYLAWKNNVPICIIRQNIYNNSYFNVLPHTLTPWRGGERSLKAGFDELLYLVLVSKAWFGRFVKMVIRRLLELVEGSK